jgi:hypothetical protein
MIPLIMILEEKLYKIELWDRISRKLTIKNLLSMFNSQDSDIMRLKRDHSRLVWGKDNYSTYLWKNNKRVKRYLYLKSKYHQKYQQSARAEDLISLRMVQEWETILLGTSGSKKALTSSITTMKFENLYLPILFDC